VTAEWIEEAFEVAGVALAAFASTNLDNLLLLTMLQGQGRHSKLTVFVGYVGAIVAIVVAGLVATRLAEALPVDKIGYLGLVPIAMGLYRLVPVRRSNDGDPAAPARALSAGAVATLTIANGGDTVAVFLPLFADTAESLTLVLAATIVGAAVLWFIVARAISQHAWVRRTLPRMERWLVPALLILVGLYILLNSSTDTMPGDAW
jgi:cadmium resistance protein CadD (predicted permease)